MDAIDEKRMEQAIDEALVNIDKGGGPFGALITFKGEVIAKTGNSVTRDYDPTAHAEINAIRQAAKHLKTFDLSGCILYTTCEPCPMCLGAIYWAKIERIFYTSTRSEAKDAGFNDEFIYDEFALPIHQRFIPLVRIDGINKARVFDKWKLKTDKNMY